jgi:hypothetical protein
MHLSPERLAAVITIAGAVVFLAAAFQPTSRVFIEPSAVRKLEIINASPGLWTATQVGFGLGAALTAVGLAIAAFHLREQSLTWLAYASVALLAVGALAWAGHLYARADDPATFASGGLPAWPLITYFVLTPAGLAGIGIILLRSSGPDWVGWLLVGSMVLILVATAIARDIPPLVYYGPTLVVGVMLYLHRP